MNAPLFRYRTSRDRRRYRAGGVVVAAGLALLLGTTDYLAAQSPIQNPTPISALPAATTPLTGNELVPLVQNGETANAPASAFGSVLSVFGRKGAVVATTGDYSFSQISGTTTPPQLPIDGATITSSGSTILVATSTASQLGAAKVDAATLTSTNGTFAAVTSTLAQLGVVKPDGSTIKVTSGVLWHHVDTIRNYTRRTVGCAVSAADHQLQHGQRHLYHSNL